LFFLALRIAFVEILAESVIETPATIFVFGRQPQLVDVALDPATFDYVVLCVVFF